MNNKMNLEFFFDKMWKDYCSLNPQAQAVFNSLDTIGEKVINDHVAFRTFSHSKLTIDRLSKHFLKYGYKVAGEYKFDQKKLNAKHFEHEDIHFPKVFISELDLSKCSQNMSNVVDLISQEVELNKMDDESFLYSGRPWEAHHQTYLKLAEESEYAAWVYAHGFRPNHFTVYINFLNKLNDIKKLNQFLKDQGFLLNSSGGEIKGNPAEYLEQSSTMANSIPVEFTEGVYHVPGCYYEFAKRYKTASGDLFQGFVVQSADKIFESTNKL